MARSLTKIIPEEPELEANKVKIRSEFGEVILGHNLQVDFSEKKDKNKEESDLINKNRGKKIETQE